MLLEEIMEHVVTHRIVTVQILILQKLLAVTRRVIIAHTHAQLQPIAT
jgi:hypothetical protein